LPLLTYSAPGACGKTRVGPQNRRPDQERTKPWGHDVRVLLSTDAGRGDEPLVGLAVRLRALDAEVRVCAPPDWPGEGSER
jgi:vancomycin aglycone glucosyltransferase